MSILSNYVKLEKLKIYSYPSEERQGVVVPYEVAFNPESYSLNYNTVFSKYQGINTSSRKARYIHSEPQNLSLTLIFDNTGVTHFSVLQSLTSTSVSSQVKDFLKQTFSMDGEKHEPRYLKIKWGELNFDCRLESVEIKYTLFDRDGTPLRAELDTKFVEDLSSTKRLLLEDKKSPDLTRSQQVVDNDNLPSLSHKIYGDSKYYIQLAAVNKINNFRSIKAGSNLIFPPLSE